MQYVRSYQFIFDNPNWLTTLLLAGLCLLIPFIGWLVLLGYAFEVMEALHRQGNDRSYPDFTFDKFGTYLVRGLWPFLVNLVVFFPVGLLFGCLIGGGTAMLERGAGHGASAQAFQVVLQLVYMVCFLGLTFVLIPLQIRAGLSQDFGSSFNMVYWTDFLAKTWVELLVSLLFLGLTGAFVMMLGALACCIGYLPASVIITLAAHHLWYQIYELYLARGGVPIPLKQNITYGAEDHG